MTVLQKYASKLDNQGLNAENATTELCPPNPNEFDMAGKISKLQYINLEDTLITICGKNIEDV